MVIAEVVRTMRLKIGLTQEEVCKRANITQGFYSHIENGGTPSFETLLKLSQAFEVPLFFIIWLATENKDVPKRAKVFFNAVKPHLDNAIKRAIE